MKNPDKSYTYLAISKLFILILLPIIILSLIINYNSITRTYLNYKYPHQLPNLHNDINYFINKNEHIDFRKVMKEEFDKIIIINLDEVNLKYTLSKHIKNNKFKLDFLEENKSSIRRKESGLEDFQLFLFLKEDKLIRYQEMNRTENYFFDIYKEKIYFKTYKFKVNNRVLEPEPI